MKNKNLEEYYQSMVDFSKVMNSMVQNSEDATRFEGVANKIASLMKQKYYEFEKQRRGLI